MILISKRVSFGTPRAYLSYVNMMAKTRMTVWAAIAMSAMALSARAADSFTTVTRQIPERGEVKSAQFKAGKQSNSFILPAGWRIGAANGGLALQPKDFGATVEIVVTKGTVSADEVQAKVLAKAPRTKIAKEYTMPTRLGAATVVEAEHATDDNLRIQSRIIMVSQGNQTVQFTFTASPEKFRQHQKAFETLVASYRAE